MQIQNLLINASLVLLQAPLSNIDRPSNIQSVSGSPKATFRKFKAEAPIQIYQSVTDQAENIPRIHYSDSSGELRKTFLESIRAAKTSIECMTFTFSDPELCSLILQKAEEGVKVTVAIDKNHMNLLLPMKDKITLVTRTAGEGRLHHKITVIDGEEVWIGSANFSPEALLKQSNTMVHLGSKDLAKALHEEMEAISRIRSRKPTLLAPIKVEDQTVELLLFPNVPFGLNQSPEKAMNDAGKKRIIELIDNAKTSLRFAVCVWTDPDLAQAVVNAKKRGVNVEVILWKKDESPDVIRLFTQENITVITKPHLTLMHNKWMLVDDEHFLNGSANWSRSWFSRNDESAIIVNHLNQNQKQSLNEYWDKLYRS